MTSYADWKFRLIVFVCFCHNVKLYWNIRTVYELIERWEHVETVHELYYPCTDRSPRRVCSHTSEQCSITPPTALHCTALHCSAGDDTLHTSQQYSTAHSTEYSLTTHPVSLHSLYHHITSHRSASPCTDYWPLTPVYPLTHSTITSHRITSQCCSVTGTGSRGETCPGVGTGPYGRTPSSSPYVLTDVAHVLNVEYLVLGKNINLSLLSMISHFILFHIFNSTISLTSSPLWLGTLGPSIPSTKPRAARLCSWASSVTKRMSVSTLSCWLKKLLLWSYLILFDLIWSYLIWFDMILLDLIWFDMILLDLIWFDLVWFDLIWFDLISPVSYCTVYSLYL